MTRFQKSFLVFVVGIVSIFGVFQFTPHVHAHELIPQVIVEFIKQHPNATPQDIHQFVQMSAPVFASKFKNIDDLMKLVRNQNTNWLDNAYDFIKLGINHILSGQDHILFVLSLLLIVASLREMVRITSAFTVGHSISLVLAGFGLLVVSPRIVEPLIALSITFVAFTTVFLKGTRFELKTAHKLGTVFFFGLFHGLGFAGLLKELAIPTDKFLSSLFSFNVGIELGQLIIVAVGLPIILLVRKTKYHEHLIKIAAFIIGTVGLVWAVQRIFFSM